MSYSSMSQSSITAPARLTVQGPDLNPPARYIVIEGPIGVGKTSLASQFASRWAMQAVFERPQDNPFLPMFYEVGARYALPTQLSFLLQRAALSREIAATNGVASPLIADFLPHKDDLFARLTLPDDEFHLYRALATQLALTHRLPDLVIYLQADPEMLWHRIQRRAIAAEQSITEHYLEAVCRAYDTFFYHYDEAPVLTINTRNFDPLASDADMDLLLERIGSMRGRKTTFVKGTP
jgi:deoxyguanosine kinase